VQAPSLVLVLAAGEGTRMRSALAKVLHPVLGRPMLGHVLHACGSLDAATTAVVTGASREAVESWLAANHPEVRTVEQQERRGTGHAVRVAVEALAAEGVAFGSEIVVLTGDTPLLQGATLEQLLAAHRAARAAATVLTAAVEDATGYGRIVRSETGAVEAIVEHNDATDAQRAINEINSGMYVFEPVALQSALARLTTNNSQGEEYLTDVIGLLRADGAAVAGFIAPDAADIAGVNDRQQLASAAAVMRDRINSAWMRNGVTIVDPQTTWIESDAVLARDVTVEPGCQIKGRTAIAEGATVGPDTTLVDCVVDEGASVVRSHCSEAHIGPHATVGPFSFLRPGAQLHAKQKLVPMSRSRMQSWVAAAKCRISRTSAMRRSVKRPTSVRRPSSSTMTASTSITPSSVTAYASVPTPCSSHR